MIFRFRAQPCPDSAIKAFRSPSSLRLRAHTLSPTTINEFRLGYSRLNFPTGQPQHVRRPSSVGFPTIFPQLASGADYPNMAITGYFTIGGATNGPQPRKDQTYQITDNFSWTKGRHSIKFGYDGRKFQVWNPFAARNEGAFTFDASGAYSTPAGPGSWTSCWGFPPATIEPLAR